MSVATKYLCIKDLLDIGMWRRLTYRDVEEASVYIY
jgi:hypothetical protein